MLYVALDAATTLFYLAPFLPVWDSASSLITFLVVATIAFTAVGGVQLVALHRLRSVPERSGAQELAGRAFTMGAVSLGCRLGYLAAIYFTMTGTNVDAIEQLLRFAAFLANLAAMGAMCSFIAMVAVSGGDEGLRKLANQTMVALVGFIVLAVILGILGVEERIVTLLALAWSLLYWFVLLRARRLTMTLAAAPGA